MSDNSKTLNVYLFLLTRQEEPGPDEFNKCIVAANTSKGAGERANSESGAEGYVWTDGLRTSCEILGVAAEGFESFIQFAKD